MGAYRRDTSEPPGDTAQPSLLSAIIRRRKRVVLVIALITALGAAALAARQPKLYTATASVAVQSPLGSSAADTPNMATEEQSAQSLAVAQRVQRQLNLAIPASTLLSHLSMGVPVNSDVLTFTYSDPSARNAQIRANAFANGYLALRQTQLQNQALQSQALTAEPSVRAQIPYLAQQLQALQAAVTPREGAGLVKGVNALATNVNNLRSQLSALDRTAQTVSGGSVIGAAQLPSSPAQNKVLSYTIIAFILGLGLGVGVAAVLEHFDDRLRDPADVRAGLGAPVLGVIPAGRGGRRRKAPALGTMQSSGWQITDAFRRLRANVIAVASETEARSILVTSIDSDDGGTAVVMKLAAAVAAAGHRVVVVLPRGLDADLESRLELNGRPGFSDALAGKVRVRDTLVRSTSFENLSFCGRGTDGATARAGDSDSHKAPLAMVTAATYSDLLGSDRPKQVIAELAAAAEYVLVEAPPVQVDADAYLLAGACDGVLAVATLATATSRDVELASDQLGRAGGRLLGSVLFDPEQRPERQRERQPEQQPEQPRTVAAVWSNGGRGSVETTNGKARVQPASNGALTKAVEA